MNRLLLCVLYICMLICMFGFGLSVCVIIECCGCDLVCFLVSLLCLISLCMSEWLLVSCVSLLLCIR